MLLRVSSIFVTDGGKTGSKAVDLLEVELLVWRVQVRGMSKENHLMKRKNEICLSGEQNGVLNC